ncbi:MAG TPA: Glu/Leu/Phe/Val dehydrogenase dimerization domain-containing protein [Candidatus Binatia bacterium]|nr:Glu/Leu/Phe/Val dehydrogenase dimerization domain-containing protein [Candidatus Binatia bacterium]
MTDDEPQLALSVRDGDETLGIVVLDRLVGGRACGGLRIAPVVTAAEVRELAAVMTRKFAFWRIACGGAKAGLVVPVDATRAERRRRTRAFGRAIAPLLRCRTYIPATDLGSRARDLWEVTRAAGMPAGPAPALNDVTSGDSAADAGRSAAVAALAALAAGGVPADGATLAVAGYGRVGAACAARFVAAGGRLVAVSTRLGAVADPAGLDLRALEDARAAHGDAAPLHYPRGRALAAADVLALPVDVLAPCGPSRVLDGTTWRAARCRVVAPGGNAAVTREADAGLTAAGVVVLPDFVANAGGVLVGHFWPLRLRAGMLEGLVEERVRQAVGALLRAAAARGTSPTRVATALAARNLERLRRGDAASRRRERLIARLGRSRLTRVVPARVLETLVRQAASTLGPCGAERVPLGA